MRESTDQPGNVRHQLLAAYCASGAKVLAWAVAAAVVYRHLGAGPFALLMLLRGTLGLFNHAAFGLGPAVLHYSALARRGVNVAVVAEPVGGAARPAATPGRDVLDYAARPVTAVVEPGSTPFSVLLHAFRLTLLLGLVAGVLLRLYMQVFDRVHDVPSSFGRDDVLVVAMIGGGVLLRAAGDVAGGASQAGGRLVADLLAAAAADLLWAGICLWFVATAAINDLTSVALPYLLTGVVAAFVRWAIAAGSVVVQAPEEPPGVVTKDVFGWPFTFRLLAYGGLVTLGGVADFLYAPIDYVILNKLVDPLAVAVYAPAVQVDAALILLVTAVASVVLPRSAIRHANKDAAGVWREYVRAAVASAGVTLVGGVAVYLLSPWLFALWLGDSLPATRAILPLVLAHTVIGATAGVGRATLLATGKAGAYAVSVLVGGLLNVGLSLWFVHLGFGLRGVIWGTLVSVLLRCVLWLPWYVRRSLRA